MNHESHSKPEHQEASSVLTNEKISSQQNVNKMFKELTVEHFSNEICYNTYTRLHVCTVHQQYQSTFIVPQ
jgi:hypothetical protein